MIERDFEPSGEWGISSLPFWRVVSRELVPQRSGVSCYMTGNMTGFQLDDPLNDDHDSHWITKTDCGLQMQLKFHAHRWRGLHNLLHVKGIADTRRGLESV